MKMIKRRQSGRRGLSWGVLAIGGLLLTALVVAIPLLAEAKDPIQYTITFGHTDGSTTTVSGTTTSNDTLVPEAGGTDKDNPIGMVMHLSCSDKFVGGWGQKKGPDPVRDSEWRVLSYYIVKGDKTCGTPPPAPRPSIDLEKATNGEDADTPTGPRIAVGGEVEWTFVVTNTGPIALFDIVLTDRQTLPVKGSPAAITCPKASLAPGESMTCRATGKAIEGQYGNLAKVTGTARVKTDAATPPPGVTSDGNWAVVTFFDAATGSRTTRTIKVTKNDVFIPDAGGTSQENPIGMVMHLSCSDKSVGGWGQKKGPDPVRDSAWQVEAYWIFEVKGGNLKTKCGEPPPATITVSDTDPSHYFGAKPDRPRVDIEKATNGEDADLPPGPSIRSGDGVVWTYVVTNTGNVDLYDLRVTDDREGAVGTIRFLAVGESATLTLKGTARAGQYANEACVAGKTKLGMQVEDCDPSHYYGKKASRPAVDLEKATNGEDADRPRGPEIPVGSTVTWTYVVTNTGSEPLWGIYLYDDREGRITCPARYLDIGKSMTCTASGTARAGQYANTAWVTAWGYTTMVKDTDPSHYYGVTHDYKRPAVDLEKATNGEDADRPRGPEIPVGSTVTWTYVITNTGSEPLWGIYLYDEQEGRITCPARYLDIGKSMTCTHFGNARAGQYANTAWVTAWGYTTQVKDTDPSHYYGVEHQYGG